MFITLLAFTIHCLGKIVEYQLSKNFGQVFVDYSGNNNHGVNGDSHSTSSKDTIPTDRGAYYSNTEIAITIPSNTLVTSDLTLAHPFTALCWVLSRDKDGTIFTRYKNDDKNNNYIKVKRFKDKKKIYIEGSQSGVIKSSNGITNSFNQGKLYLDEWKMISLIVSGKNIYGYVDNSLKVSFTFENDYFESGSYRMTIGSTSELAFEGYLWYFVILDNELLGQSRYISGHSNSCLTSSCKSCSTSINDPYLGTGCISLVNKVNQDADAKACATSSVYGCSSSGLLDCSSCTCGSCVQSGGINNCWCPSGCTTTASTCICPSVSAGWLQCCDTSCILCDSNIGTICLTCVASNSSPDGSLGCKCNPGYYGIKPLSTLTACTPCYNECATCDSANKCLTCKSLNSSPDITIGCNCNSKYYGTKPLTSLLSCFECYSECATCNQADKCLTCVSSNATPDITIGCNCNIGYYGAKPLNSANSCLKCHDHCSTCNQGNICLTCLSLNSSPSSTAGCKCNDKYYAANELTDINACQLCNQECATCNQGNKCLTCISLNSEPDSTLGCKCNDNYYKIGALTSIGSCLTCNTECNTCNDPNICLTCISQNASPSLISGCDCYPLFFAIEPLTTSTSCRICSDECVSCSGEYVCNSCKALNAIPDSYIGCNCIDGYYPMRPLLSSNSCVKCFEECETCKEPNICLTCLSNYANPNIAEGCDCINGYYPVKPLINEDSCHKCNDECLKCVGPNKCIECISSNATPNITIGCDCNPGFYSNGSLDQADSCKACNEDCKTCENDFICLSCISENASPNLIAGCDCINGYNGTSPLDENDSCSPCHQECENCDFNVSICLTCKSLYADPKSDQGCSCRTGYYSTGILLYSNSCISCLEECFNCTNNATCTSCISENSSPVIGGCECDEGFYSTGSLTTLNSCIKCHDDCKNCSYSNICDACKDPNAIIAQGPGCNCKEGYFKNTEGICEACVENCKICNNNTECIICFDDNAQPTYEGICECNLEYYAETKSPLKCSQCGANCTICKDYYTCLTCKYEYANALYSGCECPTLSSEINGTCVCKTSYFMFKNSDDTYKCSPCHISCETCVSNSKFSCKECKGYLIMNTEDNTCSLCPNGKYNMDSVCLDCHLNCSTCSDYEFCLGCEDEKKEPNPDTGICETVCEIGEVNINDVCKKCPYLCDKCNIQKNCMNCTENAEFYGNQCRCQKGFKVSNSACEAKYFKGYLSISSKNHLKLSFSKKTEKKLESKDFEIKIESNSSFTWDLIARNNQTYSFIMKFEDNIGPDVIVNLAVLADKVIYSSDNSQLLEYSYWGKLNEDYIPESIIVINQVTGAAGKVIISSSIGMGILLNPAAAWALVNTIQIIAYMPLNRNPLTPSIIVFLTSLGGFNLLPNPISYIFDSKATSPPYKEANEYGIDSSVIWINIGQTISILIVFILAYPFILLGSKFNFGKFSKRFVHILSNYRYNMFIRFWIQAYLEYGIFGLIQLKSSVNSFGVGYFHVASAVVIVILFFLTPPFILLCSYLSYKKIIDSDNLEFRNKFGSVFVEFKNDKGFFSSQYYFVYFVRRLAYILSQVYLNDFPYIQNGLNIGFSILQTGFLLYFRPFKDFTSLLSNCLGEICIVVVFSVSILFVLDLEQALKETLEKIVIYSVIVGIGAQLLISIYLFYENIKGFWQKVEKHRALSILKVYNK